MPRIAIVYIRAIKVLSKKSTCTAIRRIRGPPNSSFFLGHEWLLRSHWHVGDLEMEWYKQYGAAYRIGGCFGQDILTVADPKALQYIFHSSGYRFPKTKDFERFGDMLLGQGLAIVGGQIHQCQRRILGPAFAASRLQLFLNVFQASATKLMEKIGHRVGDVKVINMLEWTSKAALNIIGITSFRYHFNSLDDRENELMTAVYNVFGESQLWPTTLELLYPALWHVFPDWLLKPLEWIPNREVKRTGQFRKVASKIARTIFEKQLNEVANDINPAEKDIVNVLAISHLTEDAKKRMSDIEVDSQLATFIVAGHDTTANTMAWLLYELSHHPEDQAKIHKEIAQTKAKALGVLTSNDYDSMPWLNASIKEALRLHPLAYSLFRMAGQDDVLPLAEPVITSDGKLCSEIPVSKGQVVAASVYTYNRLPSVWGSDADKWNPPRFFEDRTTKQAYLGVYANLLTFSGGIRGCIGWRFAVMELQSVVTELLDNFEFSIPKGMPDLQHGPANFVLTPIIPPMKGLRFHC
ncbi:cytochrome P450 [Desarmillaria tabescens]|uniref:Cytochrome P450 n=1 Tax=Armillaria tabescens TaxID=1929756 RepID=A0AA39KAP2_ARMTA|nr:cytochrome P450 [Desarmillaria tabescens]KAK0455308.1 cytochrome P450 [Desarmillaria tabescens]